MWRAAGSALSAVSLSACATIAVDAPEPLSEARALHERTLVLDSHLDTPVLLEQPGWRVTDRHDPFTDYSQVDLPRMVEGGLDGGFWVIYTPQGPVTEEGFQAARDSAIMRGVAIREMIAAHEAFTLALVADDAAPIAEAGEKVVYLSIENAYPLGEDVSMLKTFYDMGVRMVGPVHFAHNQFSSSSTDPGETDPWSGLSPLGEALVAEANRLGVVVDASHASDEALDDMIALSKTPIILSHSGCKAVFDHPRNVDDERLLALAEAGGVIQMNAFGAYLTELPEPEPERAKMLGEAFLAFRAIETPTLEDVETFYAVRREADALYPPARADFEDYMEHLLHALELVGPDHVGIGADWDGGGGVVGMADVTALPRITERLLAEGYSVDNIEKIWGGNALRVLRAAEEHAAAVREEEGEAQ
ncbi:MAG: dipeptidase [Caulobacterales bacterium]|nr:dipeptidase [Caulobacterales bacterium]